MRDEDVCGSGRRDKRCCERAGRGFGTVAPLTALRAAFSYFSILPVGTATAPDAGTLAYLPFVGAVVGGLAGLAAWGISFVAPHVFVVAVAFGATIVLTGALHIDGYLDASDALFASVSPDRRLEIMRDPCHGTFAIASFAVLALFWAAALWSIAPARLPLTLAFAGTIVRLGVIVLACYVPYGRARARVEAFRARPSVSVLAASGVLCAILGWPLGLAALGGVACAALAFLVGVALVPRFGGGLTGDVYGLLITAGEVATLCVLGLVQAR